MKKFFLLLVFVILASCTAVKSRPQRRQEQNEVQHNYDAGFLSELKKLSQERLPKYDIRRKLHLLFDKYQLSHSERRRLIFFDGIEGIDLTSLIESIGTIVGVIGDLLGTGEGEEEEGGNKAGAEDDLQDPLEVNVPPGSTVNVVTTTSITTEESGVSAPVTATAATGKKAKGGGKRVRERRF